MNMTTATRQIDGVTIVDISGQIVFGEESSALRALVCDLLGEGYRKILLNLADVDYIDSSGLGHLVSAVASVRKMKGDLKLLKLTNKVHDVLQITKLHTIIDIMDNEAAAIESFGRAIITTA
jgi:anti-sigma B factor antagonist